MNNNRSSKRNSNNHRHGRNEMESHSKLQRRNKHQQQQHQQPIGTPQNHLTETNRQSVLVFKFLLLNTTVRTCILYYCHDQKMDGKDERGIDR
mmetsp:Transcript_32040/g.34439  ORF Transcript_32040/g.34439 Transcript_32040/m.34439 type:complete len:93 (-) Transcript_32040:132-410(-)